jgi:hypothetical protein
MKNSFIFTFIFCYALIANSQTQPNRLPNPPLPQQSQAEWAIAAGIEMVGDSMVNDRRSPSTTSRSLSSTQEYFVPLADLINLPENCDSTGSNYYQFNGNIGFLWQDTTPSVTTISAITIEYNVGIGNCDGFGTATKTPLLNGNSQTNISYLGECVCEPLEDQQDYKIQNLDVEDYLVGGINQYTFNVSNSTGFNNEPASLEGNFAKITVFYASDNDAGINDILLSDSTCPGQSDIEVELKNFGLNDLNSADIEWFVNGSPQPPVSFDDTLTPGSTAIVTLAQDFDFVNGTAYNIVANTIMPNGQEDDIPFNDAFEKNTITEVVPVSNLSQVELVQDSDFQISWDDNGLVYELEYGPQGFSLGTGTNISNINTNTYTITDLNSTNVHDVYVRSICTNGSTSDWNLILINIQQMRVAYYDDIYSIGGVALDDFNAQLNNPSNYGPSGLYNQISGFTFTSITSTLSSLTTQDLIDNFDIIFVGWLTMSEPDAQKIEQFVASGKQAIVTLDLGPGADNIFQAFGHTGSVGLNGDAPSSVTTNDPSVFPNTFGLTEGVFQFNGFQALGDVNLDQLPEGSIIEAATETKAGVWLPPNYDNKVVFMWDEGPFRIGISGAIDTNQEKYAHNIFAHVINKAIGENPCSSVPENLNISNVGPSSAELSWDLQTDAIAGYDYVFIDDGSIPGSSTTPTGSVEVGVNSVLVTGLDFATTYDVYVRSDCSVNQSAWSIVETFTTLGCSAPEALFVSNITVTSVDLNWELADSEDGGYEYVVITDGTIPDASTTPTGSVDSGISMVSLIDLDSEISYDAYVRTICVDGDLSDWSEAVSFTTASNPPIAVAQDITVQLDANGEATITPEMIDDGSSVSVGEVSLGLDITSFDCDDIGENTVILTVTDENDNSSSATAIVTVVDDLAPTVLTQNITVQLNTFGTASITPAMIDDGSFDNCSIDSYSLDISGFTTSDIGDNTVLLTVTDPSGNSDSATAVVTVEENDGTPNTLAFQDVFTDRGLASGSVAFADVDGDNDQDVVLTGALNVNAGGLAGPQFSDLFKNDGNGVFTQVIGGAPFMGLTYSSTSFIDLDNDSTLDFISTGEDISTGDNFDNFYTNDGSGVFTQFGGFAFTTLERRDFKFADLNGDADDDLLIIGQNTNGQPRVKLFQGQGSSYLPVSGISLPRVFSGSIAIADVNGDNSNDIFISGELANGTKIARIYTNNGSFQFSLLPGTPFEGLTDGDSSFADVDNDGDQDLLISGQNSSMDNVLKLYLNDGSGVFTEAVGIINLSSEIFMQAFEFADIDGDNDFDILMTGYNTTDYETVTKIWENLLNAPVALKTGDGLSSNFSINYNETSLSFGNDFKVFPNPTDRGYFNIYSPDLEGKVSVLVSDMQGRTLISQDRSVAGNNLRIMTENISSGVYMVTLKKGSESYVTKLIVK